MKHFGGVRFYPFLKVFELWCQNVKLKSVLLLLKSSSSSFSVPPVAETTADPCWTGGAVQRSRAAFHVASSPL